MRCLIGPVAALLLASGLGLGAAEYPSDLAKWVVTEPPKKNDERWLAANWDAGHHWLVDLQAGLPSARPASEKGPAPPTLPFAIERGTAAQGLAGRRLPLKVDDGWLIAFNAGEWGGWLWWFSPDGTRRYKIASDCWINGFHPTDAGLLAVEGISHGVTSRGGVVRLSRKADGRWHSEAFVALDEEARCAAKDADGTLIVATWERLLRVHLATRKVDVLLRDAFWAGLYPDSMAVTPAGTIYLGMRHGVARVEKRGGAYRVDWLLPSPDFDRITEGRGGLR